MRRAVLQALALGLWRDRGALVMSFALPVIVFLVFAAILSGATGDQLRLRVVVANESGDKLSVRLVDALAKDSSLRVVGPLLTDAAAVDVAVAAGAADAGIVIRRGGRPLDDLIGEAPAPVVVITHPARAVAGSIVSGVVQRVYFSALPDAALRGAVTLVDSTIVELTGAQRAEAEATLTDLTASADGASKEDRASGTFETLVELRPSSRASGPLDQVTYYAAAVAAMFVFLSAVHGASSVHDDRENGILDRILAGPAGATAIIDGRAMFLIGQGMAQSLVIFLVAWSFYARRWPVGLGAWLVVTLALGAASAGLTLLVACLCRSTRQSHTASNVLVLVASAVGGSMIPRYLMPSWLQSVGWASPNAWVIEGYTRALGAGSQGEPGVVPAAVLLTAGIAGWLVARWKVARWETT